MSCLDSLLLAIAAFLLRTETGWDMEHEAMVAERLYGNMKSAYECVTREMVEKKLYVDTTIICSVFIDSSTTPPTHREVECDTVIKLKRRDDTAITSTNR